ncbi:protein FAM163A-like [Clinocottus analis]|uniref:protein FAM163A-like n=1 Tax=Clinocottus analis TaxID=304258 RepID=UPI0035C03720
MSAGTIVISGGILAGVILLCIVAVLCYCRLQYYCCKKSGSEVEVGSAVDPDPLAHFPCDACNALAMDGAAVAPAAPDRPNSDSGARHDRRCAGCSPYALGHAPPEEEELRNGGERLGFHTYYENPCVTLPLPANPQLSYYDDTDMFPPPPRPYSTDV